MLCPGNEFSYQGHRNSDVISYGTRQSSYDLRVADGRGLIIQVHKTNSLQQICLIFTFYVTVDSKSCTNYVSMIVLIVESGQGLYLESSRLFR